MCTVVQCWYIEYYVAYVWEQLYRNRGLDITLLPYFELKEIFRYSFHHFGFNDASGKYRSRVDCSCSKIEG